MKSIRLGARDGHPVNIDLSRLLDSRLLIQGTSGSGKSNVARLIVEKAHEHVQCIVIDPEGEYATLREKFPFFLFGPGGERGAEVHKAGMIARIALQVGRSTIIDLSETKEYVEFFRRFGEGLMSAPKALRHPTLLLVEEMQLFAPEGGKGEATEVAIDVAKRGRKRGICTIAVTQRISDLSKGVCGVLGSRLIGLTTLDTDIKRAAYDLGMEPKDGGARLKALEQGDFFAYGPGFGFRGVEQIHVDKAATDAPKWVDREKPPPPTPKALESMLARLDEIPKQAEAEATTLAEAKTKIRELERQVREKPAPAAPAAPKAPRVVERFVLKDGQLGRAEAFAGRLDKVGASLVEAANTIAAAIRETKAAPEWDSRESYSRLIHGSSQRGPQAPVTPRNSGIAKTAISAAPLKHPSATPPSDGSLSPSQQKAIDVFAMLTVRGIPATAESVARWLDVHPRGGSYLRTLAFLRASGYIEGWTLTPHALDSARSMPTGLDGAYAALPNPSWKTALQEIASKPERISTEDLAAILNVHPRGGSYLRTLARLRQMGLITSRGPIALTEGATR